VVNIPISTELSIQELMLM